MTGKTPLEKGVYYYVVPPPEGVTPEQVDAFMIMNVEACKDCTFRTTYHEGKPVCSIEELRKKAGKL